jgi:hypothetical protein
MMKPDPDIDTEKYSGHNIHNNMFIKTFPDPGNMKIVSLLTKTNFIAAPHDVSIARRRMKMIETKANRSQSTPYSPYSPHSPHSPIFMAGRDAIRRRNGVRGHCVLKKVSYYTFPPRISTLKLYISTT